MKTMLLRLLNAATFLAMVHGAGALITDHGRERLHCSGWSLGLTALVNHPARVSGRIGPLAPTAQFHFVGDSATFNQLLAQYAALNQKLRVLYLSSDAASLGEGHEFDLSITHGGHGFLHLHTAGRIQLEDLKILRGVAVEAFPLGGLPSDPEQRAELEAEQNASKHGSPRAKRPPM